MTETKTQTSVATLKNLQKHLVDVVDKNESMSRIMGSVANDLQGLAPKTGELYVQIWRDGGYKAIQLKSYLTELACSLEKGRI